MIIMVSGKYNKERCALCGRYISIKDLGTKAVKMNEGYLADFAHVDCLAKLANKTAEILKKGESK